MNTDKKHRNKQRHSMTFVAVNRYVEESRPWDLAGEDSDAERLEQVLYGLAEGLRVVTLLLHPYMPATSQRLLEALAESGRRPAEFGSRGGGQRTERIAPLFPKLEA